MRGYSAVAISRRFCGKFQHWLEQTVIPNCELRRVDTDSNSTRASGMIIPGERALTPFVELAGRRQCERVSGNDDAFAQGVSRPNLRDRQFSHTIYRNRSSRGHEAQICSGP